MIKRRRVNKPHVVRRKVRKESEIGKGRRERYHFWGQIEVIRPNFLAVHDARGWKEEREDGQKGWGRNLWFLRYWQKHVTLNKKEEEGSMRATQ